MRISGPTAFLMSAMLVTSAQAQSYRVDSSVVWPASSDISKVGRNGIAIFGGVLTVPENTSIELEWVHSVSVYREFSYSLVAAPQDVCSFKINRTPSLMDQEGMNDFARMMSDGEVEQRLKRYPNLSRVGSTEILKQGGMALYRSQFINRYKGEERFSRFTIVAFLNDKGGFYFEKYCQSLGGWARLDYVGKIIRGDIVYNEN